ncbi:unnamed protein product [Schistosoma turkestanicum]|nr:unnamed protein product [Schistosoma turkestanicum]
MQCSNRSAVIWLGTLVNELDMNLSEEPLDLTTKYSRSSQVSEKYENKYKHCVKRKPTPLELELGCFVRKLTHKLLNPNLSITRQSQKHLNQIEEACKKTFPQFDSRQIRSKIRAQLKLYRRTLKRVNKKISVLGQCKSSLEVDSIIPTSAVHMAPLQPTVISSLSSLSSVNHLLSTDKIVFQQQSNTSLSSDFLELSNNSPANSKLINLIQQTGGEYTYEVKNKERSINLFINNSNNIQLFESQDNLSANSKIVEDVTVSEALTEKHTSSATSTSNSSMSSVPVSLNTDSIISTMEPNGLCKTYDTSINDKNDKDMNVPNTKCNYLPSDSISNIPLVYPLSLIRPPLIDHPICQQSNPIISNHVAYSTSSTNYLVPIVPNITTGIVSLSSTIAPSSVFSTPNTTTSLLSVSLRATAIHLIQTARLYEMFVQPNQTTNDNHQSSILNAQSTNDVPHGAFYSSELENLTNFPLNLEHKLSQPNLQPN